MDVTVVAFTPATVEKPSGDKLIEPPLITINCIVSGFYERLQRFFLPVGLGQSVIGKPHTTG